MHTFTLPSDIAKFIETRKVRANVLTMITAVLSDSVLNQRKTHSEQYQDFLKTPPLLHRMLPTTSILSWERYKWIDSVMEKFELKSKRMSVEETSLSSSQPATRVMTTSWSY